MAITFGTITSGVFANTAAGGTVTVSVNTTGAVALAVCASTRPLLSDGADCITGIAFNTSEALTRRAYAAQGAPADAQAHVWLLEAPTETTADVVATITGTTSARGVLWCVPIIGADPADIYGTTANTTGISTTPSLAVASTVGNLILGVMTHRDTLSSLTVDGDTTQLGTEQTNTPGSSAHVKSYLFSAAGGASASPSGVIDNSEAWGIAAVELNVEPPPAAGGVILPHSRARRVIAARYYHF